MNQVTANRIWARLILESLARQGITDICIAPGSRSTPLTLEAGSRNDIRLHTHFDERGLGFLALGLAKASHRAVAIIVTSGTAVANLLPAVAESRLTREKLVLLTADRPAELIQCGANQAISQINLFGDHVQDSLNLPSPSAQISPQWLLSSVSELLASQDVAGGSIHLNCPFPEPLYGEPEGYQDYLSPLGNWLAGDSPYLQFTTPKLSPFGPDVFEPSLGNKKGVLIAGKLADGEIDQIEKLAELTGWPLLCDPQAGHGSDYSGFDVWLQSPHCAELLGQAEVVIQFGARLVSKRLGQFLGGFNGQYWLVDPYAGRLDPGHLQGRRICAPVASVVTALCDGMDTGEQAGWASALAVTSDKYLQSLQQALVDNNPVTELAMATDFSRWLGPESDVFVGNSLAIRLLDMCCKLPRATVYANRGASGIDGLVATAAGVQRARSKAMVMLVGDTSALYDLNSLALLANNPEPLALVIVNNDGGGIFDMLPVPASNKESFYRMPHGFEFSRAAEMFGLGYVQPVTLADARTACLDAQSRAGTTIIEISVPPGEAGNALRNLFNKVKDGKLC